MSETPFGGMRDDGAVHQARQFCQEAINQLEELLKLVHEPTTARRCENEIASAVKALERIAQRFRERADETDDGPASMT